MHLSIVSLLILLLSTCGHSHSPKTVRLNEEFELRLQERASLETEKLTIQFTALLQDSRCPKGAQCITQGNASIELQLSKDEQQAITLQLNTDSGAKEETYHKYRIVLVALNPYPVSGQETDPSHYVATLLITPA
jgi:hypothetical protein